MCISAMNQSVMHVHVFLFLVCIDQDSIMSAVGRRRKRDSLATGMQKCVPRREHLYFAAMLSSMVYLRFVFIII